ncbi:GAF domain-containing sensor histidine kinase [Acidimangrovimonas sediminis]|uniref:GAF domain-containing sensor histidine kinase n=1 Tax=Acidimangrovimonas sediminis TaxID=2056283 RepID=UPI001E396EED|nr:ATP-binding protein [Acidimangrovimonas sediminis]
MRHSAAGAPDARDILLRISAHLAGEVEVRGALDAVADEMRAILPFTHADICLHDAPGWLVSYEVGLRTRWPDRRTRLNASPVRALMTGEVDTMLTANAMCDPRQVFPGAACGPILEHGLRSRVHATMRIRGEVIGSLNFSHVEEGRYSTRDLAQVRQLSDVLAPYFYALRAGEKARHAAVIRAEAQAREEGLRLGALGLTQALEDQRQRIGMDLHDEVLADLTHLLRRLDGEGVVPDRAEIGARISDCIQDLRRIIDLTVPTLLDLFGFNHAVREHLTRAATGAGAATDLLDRSDEAVDGLDPTVRTALFRMTQEAINNAARHSGAGLIRVLIDRAAAGRLRVRIEDDGRGFDPAALVRQSGLSHMRIRARLISADLQISHEAGTAVSITLHEAPPREAGVFETGRGGKGHGEKNRREVRQ